MLGCILGHWLLAAVIQQCRQRRQRAMVNFGCVGTELYHFLNSIHQQIFATARIWACVMMHKTAKWF